MIKLFLTDIDGTLTDGTYYCFPDLEQRGKRYHTRDFQGLLMLHEAGVRVGVLSRANSAADKKQFGHAASFAVGGFGIQNKAAWVRQQFIDPGYCLWADIAFVGDDVIDMPLLEIVGMAACPADADPTVIKLIERRRDGVVLNNRGGRACVREFINMVLAYNGNGDSNG